MYVKFVKILKHSIYLHVIQLLSIIPYFVYNYTFKEEVSAIRFIKISLIWYVTIMCDLLHMQYYWHAIIAYPDIAKR